MTVVFHDALPGDTVAVDGPAVITFLERDGRRVRMGINVTPDVTITYGSRALAGKKPAGNAGGKRHGAGTDTGV
jgi:hypothetical protein